LEQRLLVAQDPFLAGDHNHRHGAEQRKGAAIVSSLKTARPTADSACCMRLRLLRARRERPRMMNSRRPSRV